MKSSIQQFKNSLGEQHYSLAFIKHLVDTITNNNGTLLSMKILPPINRYMS